MPVKSSVEILKNFVAFPEYMNFIKSYVVKDSLMEFKRLHRISNAVVWLRPYLFSDFLDTSLSSDMFFRILYKFCFDTLQVF